MSKVLILELGFAQFGIKTSKLAGLLFGTLFSANQSFDFRIGVCAIWNRKSQIEQSSNFLEMRRVGVRVIWRVRVRVIGRVRVRVMCRVRVGVVSRGRVRVFKSPAAVMLESRSIYRL